MARENSFAMFQFKYELTASRIMYSGLVTIFYAGHGSVRSVQGIATRLVPIMRGLHYDSRLREVRMFSIETVHQSRSYLFVQDVQWIGCIKGGGLL